MRCLIILFLSFLLIACSNEVEETTPSGSDSPPPSLFTNLSTNETNLKTISINGYDRHFSITFPISYNKDLSYPVVLFFHGCMCRSDFTDESILSYLNWEQRLESYKNDFIVIKMSAFSEKKPQTPQLVEQGGARGMWFWHEGLEDDRDDYQFVDSLVESLLSSSEINIDPELIFGVGHSSGAIFLMSYVLGGPTDLVDFSINDNYSFKAISVTGGSTLRKGIVDFKENTPEILPSVLHIQGEEDGGLWFNGQETGKRGINFLEFVSESNGADIVDGLRDTIHGLTYSAWDENNPSSPSTLERWANYLNLKYSGFQDHPLYYIYNFEQTKGLENILIGMRIKNCGHRLSVDNFQSNYFRIFSYNDNSQELYLNMLSRDTAINLC